MKIKDYRCKCGHNDFFFANKGNQKGIYCSYCGKWFKWADKDEQNLSMKQQPILDKIRSEIMQLDYDTEYVDYDYDDMPQTEEVHMICREEVLQIIDDYRKESKNE